MLTLNVLCLDDNLDSLSSLIADVFNDGKSNIQRDLFANRTLDTVFQLKGLLGGEEKTKFHFFRHASMDPDEVIREIKANFSKKDIDVVLLDNNWGEGILATFGSDEMAPVILQHLKSPFEKENPIQMFPKLFIISENFDLHEAKNLLVDGVPQHLDHAARINAIPKRNSAYLRLCIIQAINEKQLICAFHKQLEQSHTAEKRQQEENKQIKQVYGFSDNLSLSCVDIPRPLAGVSTAMKIIRQKTAEAAETDYPLLILGETGTGKENVAQAVRQQSYRKDEPFISVNCAAISSELVEPELFGYVKGAFTGAVRDHKGYFEQANNGTIFLDEIGDASPALQVKLLRVLQESEIRRVGDENRPIKVNVRIIAATNIDLTAAMKNKTFRKDLYFRLAFHIIRVPPLNDRHEDIPEIVSSIMKNNSHFVVKDFIDCAALFETLNKNRSLPLHGMILELLKENNENGNLKHSFMKTYKHLLDDEGSKKLYEYLERTQKRSIEEEELIERYRKKIIFPLQIRRLNRLILESIAPDLISIRVKIMNKKLKKELVKYDWKGNIRGLESSILRALSQCQSQLLTEKHFPEFNIDSGTTEKPKNHAMFSSVKGLNTVILNKHVCNVLAWVKENPDFMLLKHVEIKEQFTIQFGHKNILGYFKGKKANIKKAANESDEARQLIKQIEPLFIHCNIWTPLG
ncbi:MAG: sigma 54-interacting transcriptional regulator [Mariprofundaceae bacterium]|nr:sigma 54-interacting transcriptional regulator [Mariprofundaceae bacterium]